VLGFDFPLSDLEYSLHKYLEGDGQEPFSSSDIVVAPKEANASDERKNVEVKEEVLAIKDNSIEVIKAIPEFESLGKIYK
jgi:hypothetical protein